MADQAPEKLSGEAPGKPPLSSKKGESRIKCEICQKWKHISQYSNIQLSRPYNKKCMMCASGDQRSELRCEGPCSKFKPLSEFSKSSRKAGGNKYCKICTNWKMSVEPGVSVAPTPGQLIEEVEDIPTNDVEGQDDGDNFDEFEPTESGGDWYQRPTGTRGYETTGEAQPALSSLSLLDTPKENRVQNTNSRTPNTSNSSDGWIQAGGAAAAWNAWGAQGEFARHQPAPSSTFLPRRSISAAARSSSQWAPRAARSLDQSQPRLPSPPPPQESTRPRARYDLDGDSDSDTYD